MGFIGYQRRQGSQHEEMVRVFLECQEAPEPHGDAAAPETGSHVPVACTYAVDVVFRQGEPACRLRGVDGILVLKKFYKLIASLEERAREHGHGREKAIESAESLVQHLNYTRNARDFSGQPEPKLLPPSAPLPGREPHQPGSLE